MIREFFCPKCGSYREVFELNELNYNCCGSWRFPALRVALPEIISRKAFPDSGVFSSMNGPSVGFRVIR